MLSTNYESNKAERRTWLHLLSASIDNNQVSEIHTIYFYNIECMEAPSVGILLK